MKIQVKDFVSGQEPDDYDDEFAADVEVKVEVQGREVARLLGVQERVLRRTLEKLTPQEALRAIQRLGATKYQKDIERFLKEYADEEFGQGARVEFVDFSESGFHTVEIDPKNEKLTFTLEIGASGKFVDYEENPAKNINDALADLDFKLTNREAAPTSHVRTVNINDVWEGREIYLSDGGYSRVVYNLDTGKLFLTSNSRDQVRAKWEAAAKERKVVEDIIEKHWDMMDVNPKENPPVVSTMKYEVDVGTIDDARQEFEALRPLSCPSKRDVDKLTNLLLWSGGVMTGANVSERIKREAAQLHIDIKEHLAVVTCPQLKAKLLR